MLLSWKIYGKIRNFVLKIKVLDLDTVAIMGGRICTV
jgi:hypothetical protein